MIKYVKNGLRGKNQYGFMTPYERFCKNTLIPNDENDCMLWTGTKLKNGYGHMGVNGKLMLAHRLSYLLHYGILPKNLHVLHKCDNPSCVRPDHLFLGTDKDNARDCINKGRDTCFKKGMKSVADNRGTKSKKSKLTEDKVIEIKIRLRENQTVASIARLYLISPSIISGIKNGYRWKHV